jgi:hypothetical protein
VLRRRLVGVAELPADGGAGEIALGQPRRDLVARDRVDGRDADVDLATAVMRRPVDRVGRDLGLIERRDGLRALAELTPSNR